MAPLTLERKGGSWLETHTHDWVEAGLISVDQADEIKRYEHVGEAAPPQRLPFVAEVATYVGSILTLMGGAAVVGEYWADLVLLGQLGVALGIMAVGFVTGTWLIRLGEAGTERLGSFLWVVGTGGVATGVFAVMKEIDPDNDGIIPLVVGLAVLAVGLGLWRNLARPLQLVTVAVGFAISLAGLGELIDPPAWVGGLVLLAVGLPLAAGAALHKIEPRLLALSIGAIAAYIGAFTFGELSEPVGPAAALLIGIAVIGLALRESLIPLLTLGVIASLIATQALLATTFTDAVSALVVTLLGLAIVIAAVVKSRRPAS